MKPQCYITELEKLKLNINIATYAKHETFFLFFTF